MAAAEQALRTFVHSSIESRRIVAAPFEKQGSYIGVHSVGKAMAGLDITIRPFQSHKPGSK
jgi:hypothetical protein